LPTKKNKDNKIILNISILKLIIVYSC